MTLNQVSNLSVGDKVQNVYTGHVFVVENLDCPTVPQLRSTWTQTKLYLDVNRYSCFQVY